MNFTSQEEILDYVSSSLEQVKELTEENQKLQQKLAQLNSEKVRLEKVANNHSLQAFDDAKIHGLLNSLVTFNVIEKTASKSVYENLQQDPNYALDLIETLIKTASEENEGNAANINFNRADSDPHGWGKIVNK